MLLKNDEPAPYTILNERGSAKIILIADHASNRIPKSLNKLGLNDRLLSSHIAWDIGAGDLAKALSLLLDAPLILANYSRLVIDCNRAPGSMESIIDHCNEGKIPGNTNLNSEQILVREDSIFTPYHDAISRVLEEQNGFIAIVSIHSFTRILNKQYRPWKIGVCYGKDAGLAKMIMACLEKNKIYSFGDNEPYSIDLDIDYSLPHHAKQGNNMNVMLEIRNDEINTNEGIKTWSTILKKVFDEICDNI